MPSAPRKFEVGGIYHIFTRGIDKRITFFDARDYERFLAALAFYQQSDPPTRLSYTNFVLTDRTEPLRFAILAYCLMPNHFHLVVQLLEDGGLTRGISDLLNSYTRYFNLRHGRIGSLFHRPFKSVKVDSDEQLVHVIRYGLLNASVAGLVDDPSNYQWCSYHDLFTQSDSLTLSDPSLMRSFFPSPEKLRSFLIDHLEYARSLDQIKQLVLE